MRLGPAGRPRQLVALGAAGAVVGHGLTVAWLAHGPGGSTVVSATGHLYWTSWGPSLVAAAVATAAISLVTFALGHLRSSCRSQQGTLAGASLWLAAAQLTAFVATEVLERLIAHDGWTTAFDHRVLLCGSLLQLVIACASAQALRLVRRAALHLVERRRAPYLRTSPGRWPATVPASVPALRWVGLAPSRAPPSIA